MLPSLNEFGAGETSTERWFGVRPKLYSTVVWSLDERELYSRTPASSHGYLALWNAAEY